MGNTFYYQIKQNAETVLSKSEELHDKNEYNSNVCKQNFLNNDISSTNKDEINTLNIKLECQDNQQNPKLSINQNHYFEIYDNKVNDDSGSPINIPEKNYLNFVESNFLKCFEIFSNHHFHQTYLTQSSLSCNLDFHIKNNLYCQNSFNSLDKYSTKNTNLIRIDYLNSKSSLNDYNDKNFKSDGIKIINDDNIPNNDLNNHYNINENCFSNDEEYSRVKSITLTSENGEEYKTTYLVIKSSTNNIKTKNKHKVALRTMYFCQKCPYKLIDFSRFKIHLLRHKYELGSIKCRYCEYYDFTSFKMRQHESLHPEYHPIKSFESNEKIHSCHLCPHKTTNACQLTKHLLKHQYKEGHFKCRYCHYFVAKMLAMKKHETLHIEYKPRKIIYSK